MPWLTVITGLGECGDRLTAEQLGVQLTTLILGLLVDLDRDTVGVGPCVLSDAGHLLGHLLLCPTSSDGESPIFHLARDVQIRGSAADCSELVAIVPVECLKPIRQLYRRLAP